MNKIKSSAAFASAAICLVAFAVPAFAQTKSLWDKIQTSGELVCGGLPDHAPAGWKVSTPAEYEGYIANFCRAIVEDLSKALGKKISLKFEQTNWATVVLDTQSGRIDLAGGLSVTEERKKALDMPGPAYSLADAIIYRKGYPVYKTWEEYNKAEVRSANTTGTSTEKTSQELLPKAQQLSFKQRPELILAIQSGRADISVSAYVAALSALKEGGAIFGGMVVPTPRNEQPSSFGVRKDGDGRFRDWVQQWSDKARADGRVRELIKDSLLKAGLSIENLDGLGS